MDGRDEEGSTELVDAIPYDTLGLSEVYKKIQDLISSSPDRQFEIDKTCADILDSSRMIDREVTPLDIEDFEEGIELLHHCRRANLLLRNALNDGDLIACVRDPQTGERLKLPSKDWWFDSSWKEYTPWGLWDDYLGAKDSETPGPRGSTVLRNVLRPVFIHQTDFERWVLRVFGAEHLTLSVAQPAKKSRLGHLRKSISEEIAKRFPDGIRGVAFKDIERSINADRTAKGLSLVSDSTLRRAIETYEGTSRIESQS